MHDRPLILCRSDRVGDAIIATCCLDPIRRWKPGLPIVFAARETMRPLLEGHPHLEGFIAIPSEPAARQRLVADLRRWDAQAFVALHPDALAQSAARSAGIRRRIGFRSGFLANRTLTERLSDRRDCGLMHEAEYILDLLVPLGLPLPPDVPLRPSIHLPDSWLRSLQLRLGAAGWTDFGTIDRGDFAVINPSAFSVDLRWPPENFTWLIRELLGQGLVARVVLVAGDVNDPSVQRIRFALGRCPGMIDLSGSTNLAELGWLLRYASMLISRNTGTTHLAAAVNCPTVEIFGRLEPRYGPIRWRALGPRTKTLAPRPLRQELFESRRAFWRRGHAAVSREDVLAAARALVETPPDPRF